MCRKLCMTSSVGAINSSRSKISIKNWPRQARPVFRRPSWAQQQSGQTGLDFSRTATGWCRPDWWRARKTSTSYSLRSYTSWNQQFLSRFTKTWKDSQCLQQGCTLGSTHTVSILAAITKGDREVEITLYLENTTHVVPCCHKTAENWPRILTLCSWTICCPTEYVHHVHWSGSSSRLCHQTCWVHRLYCSTHDCERDPGTQTDRSCVQRQSIPSAPPAFHSDCTSTHISNYNILLFFPVVVTVTVAVAVATATTTTTTTAIITITTAFIPLGIKFPRDKSKKLSL